MKTRMDRTLIFAGFFRFKLLVLGSVDDFSTQAKMQSLEKLHGTLANTEKSKERKKDLGKITTQLVTFMMALFNYDHKNPSVFCFLPTRITKFKFESENEMNRPFPSCFEPHYESEAKCKVFVMKISFHSYANKANFHMKSFALSLAFIVRFTATRKCPIVVVVVK